MPEELAVAAVAVFPVLLVGRRRGTGAPLRAAVFILPLLQLKRRVTQSTVCHFMPFACLVSTNKCVKMTLTHCGLASCFEGRWVHQPAGPCCQMVDAGSRCCSCAVSITGVVTAHDGRAQFALLCVHGRNVGVLTRAGLMYRRGAIWTGRT